VPVLTPQRAEEIKALLRQCQTVEQVNALARSVGSEVQDMAEHPTHAVHATHIRNLADYMRRFELTDEVPRASGQ